MNFPFANGFSNDYYGMQPSFEANEQEEDPTEFLNSILADEDEFSYEERIQTLLNDTSPPISINMIQLVDGGASSDTDADVVHGRVKQYCPLTIGVENHSNS